MTKIHNWEELSKVKPSKTHFIEVYLGAGYGLIQRLDGKDVEVLSTHTFYNKRNTENANRKLKKCGFDIELTAWEE